MSQCPNSSTLFLVGAASSAGTAALLLLHMGQPHVWVPESISSSVLSSGGVKPMCGAAVPTVWVLQCFASSTLSPGGTAPYEHKIDPTISALSLDKVGSTLSRQGKAVCAHNPMGVGSSTLPYLLDQSLGGEASCIHTVHSPVSAGSSSKKGGQGCYCAL